MKIKIKVFVHFTKYTSAVKGGEYEVFPIKLDDSSYRSFVNEQEIEIEVEEGYDPRAQQIAALEAQKQKIMADYQKSVTEINDRISKLLALEYAA